MTDDFKVITLEQEFLEDVTSLWTERFADDYIARRRIIFEWLTGGNPFDLRHNCYFLLLHQRKVIGMHGHMPLSFHVNGHEATGYLAHDDLLAKDYRGKGLGKVLLNGVAEQASEFSGALWFNEPNYKLYQKSGWTDIPQFYPYYKIFDPTSLIEREIKNEIVQKLVSLGVKVFLKARKTPGNKNLYSEIDISPVERFDDEYDKLFEKISTHFGFIVARTEKYLNWKFIQKPFNNYKIFAAADKTKQLSGFIVLKSETFEGGRRGKILDILAHPEKPEVFGALIHKGIQEFERIGASYIEIVCTYPPFVKLLKKMGFIRRPNPLRFMVRNWEGQYEREFIGDIKNWYLTLGDADGDAWAVDAADAWNIR